MISLIRKNKKLSNTFETISDKYNSIISEITNPAILDELYILFSRGVEELNNSVNRHNSKINTIITTTSICFTIVLFIIHYIIENKIIPYNIYCLLLLVSTVVMLLCILLMILIQSFKKDLIVPRHEESILKLAKQSKNKKELQKTLIISYAVASYNNRKIQNRQTFKFKIVLIIFILSLLSSISFGAYIAGTQPDKNKNVLFRSNEKWEPITKKTINQNKTKNLKKNPKNQ